MISYICPEESDVSNDWLDEQITDALGPPSQSRPSRNIDQLAEVQRSMLVLGFKMHERFGGPGEISMFGYSLGEAEPEMIVYRLGQWSRAILIAALRALGKYDRPLLACNPSPAPAKV